MALSCGSSTRRQQPLGTQETDKKIFHLLKLSNIKYADTKMEAMVS